MGCQYIKRVPTSTIVFLAAMILCLILAFTILSIDIDSTLRNPASAIYSPFRKLADYTVLPLLIGGIISGSIAMFTYLTYSGKKTVYEGGAMLLDCGLTPRRWEILVLFLALLFCQAGIQTYFRVASQTTHGFSLYAIYGFFLVTYGSAYLPILTYLLCRFFTRIQIREQGICYYWSLWRWGKIKSYHWQGQKLCFTATTGKSAGKSLKLEFPPNSRYAVDTLLREHKVPEAENK